jgi:hypothetical protein
LLCLLSPFPPTVIFADYGLLGAGLYFGGESCTSAKYTSAGAQGTRFMLLNRVALGNIHEVYAVTPGLSTLPPCPSSKHGRTARLMLGLNLFQFSPIS